MSDIAAAAAALGLPESLTQRSAEARAAETGASVDDILSEWSGGAPAPAAATPAEAATAPEAEDQPTAETTPAPPEIIVAAAARVAPEPVPAGPYEPPVLVGARDNPMAILLGVLGLFALILMIGLVGPASQAEEPGARTSDLSYTEAAVEGQDVYGSLGCAACHTQLVRPVIADIGLGGVTLNDSNQVLGTRRFGPDLSDIGTRMSASQIEATIGGLGDHPAHTLSTDDLTRLVAYLSQSHTTEGG